MDGFNTVSHAGIMPEAKAYVVNMFKKITLMAGILLVIFFLIIKTVDIPQFLAVVRNLTLADVSILIGLSLSLEALKVIRFFLLLKDRHIPVSLFQSIKIYLSAESATLVPGGEGWRVVLLNKETNSSAVQTTAPALSSSLFDSVVAAILVTAGALIYPELRVAAIIVDGLLVSGIMVMLHPYLFSLLTSLMAKIPKLSEQVDFLMKVRGVLVNLLTADNHQFLPGQATLYAFMLSLAGLVIGGYFFYYLIHLLGGSTSLPLAVLLYASSIVIAAISGMIPAGLGLTEGGITGILYVIAKLSYQQAISVALIYRVLTSGLYMLLGSITAAILYRAQIKAYVLKDSSSASS